MEKNGTHQIKHGRWLHTARWAAWAVALLALCFALAYGRVALLSYNPVNGDFQSYNVFRRMLAGQTPYVHFANYIGMAPVVLNLPFLLPNGSFAASLFVTNFTCCLLFCLCVLAVCWLATQNGPVSMLVSVCLTKGLSSGLLGALGGAGAYLDGLFRNLYTPSNSMRVARAFWPFLLVLAFLLFDKIRWHRRGEHYNLVKAPLRPAFCAIWGTLAGLGVTWSSDFGFATALATVLLAAALLAAQRPGAACFLKNFGLLIACIAAGAALSITLVTGGHPAAWLAHTAGVAEYQYFYFNGASGRALLRIIFTNPRLLAATSPYVLFLGFCAVRLWRQKLSTRLALAAFLALCVPGATYAYVLSGSGYNFTEALEGFLWLGLAAGALAGLLWAGRRYAALAKVNAGSLLAAVAITFTALAARDVLARQNAPREGTYVEALGGYVNYPKALGEAAALTEGYEVFSVYATGLEVLKGQFQPTGYDYIIHALGDEARAEYVANFAAGRYPFAQTMALDLERWLVVENWDFYRELAGHYIREARTEYSWLWRRVESAQAPIDAELTLTEREDGRWLVEVTAPPGSDFIADVELSYSTGFTSAGGAALSLGRKCVAARVPDPLGGEDEVWGYFAAENDALHLPIAVRNGEGRALLLPCDVDFVALEVHSARVVRALPDMKVPDAG